MRISGKQLKEKVVLLEREVLVDSVIGLVYISNAEALVALMDDVFYEVRFSTHAGCGWITIWKKYSESNGR